MRAHVSLSSRTQEGRGSGKSVQPERKLETQFPFEEGRRRQNLKWKAFHNEKNPRLKCQKTLSGTDDLPVAGRLELIGPSSGHAPGELAHTLGSQGLSSQGRINGFL